MPPGTGNAGRPLAIKFGLVADINSIEPYGTTTYDGLADAVHATLGQLGVRSCLHVVQDDQLRDNDGGPRIQYLPEKERNRGQAGYDRTHNLQMYGVYDLPFGKGRRLAREGWASAIFGCFQVSGVVSLMSGLPFYVVQGSAPNLLAGGSQQVPNQLNPTISTFGGIGTAAQPECWTMVRQHGAWSKLTANCAWAPETGARFGSAGRLSF